MRINTALHLNRPFLALFAISVFFSLTPLPSVAQPSALEIIELQISMAERSFLAKDDLPQRAALAHQLERKTAFLCYGSVAQTLQYNPKMSSKECLASIPAVLNLDAANPIALCARDGFDAPACRDAYRRQLTGFYNTAGSWSLPDNSAQGMVQLSTSVAVDEQASRSARGRVQEQIQAVKYLASSSPTAQLELGDLTSRLLALSCNATQLALLPPAAESTAASTGENSSPPASLPDSPLGRVLEEFSAKQQARAVPTPTPFPYGEPLYRRVRLIPSTCSDALTQVRRVAPRSPEILCAEAGPFSPGCIQARRMFVGARAKLAQLAQQEQQPSGSSSSSAGQPSSSVSSRPAGGALFDSF